MVLASTHPAIHHLTYLQAVVIGLIQGVFELFPLSSLGHTVLIPSWIGGSWATLVRQESRPESPYLAFIVGLHLANAVALLLFYIREWARLIAGFFVSLARRKARTDTERLAWMIVIATIPVGILGVLFEHAFRVLFAKPVAAAGFLCVNGLILLAGQRILVRRRREGQQPAALIAEAPASAAEAAPELAGASTPSSRAGTPTLARSDARAGYDTPPQGALVVIDRAAEAKLAGIGVRTAFVIGASQALALLAGISREGVVIVGGLARGLDRENAMRFAFLLSTPVIFAAGVLKVPDLLGPLGNGIRGQTVAGSLAAVVASLTAIFLLARWFRSRSGSLLPFAVYSLLFGVASVVRFGVF